jgi:hypothetical protein
VNGIQRVPQTNSLRYLEIKLNNSFAATLPGSSASETCRCLSRLQKHSTLAKLVKNIG